jgi:hypothetical protein
MFEMVQELSTYKKIFDKFDKTDLYEINIPFLENMISTKKNIEELEKLPMIRTHSEFKHLQKQTESGKMLIKLYETYKNQTLALNKILGNAVNLTDEDDPFLLFKEKHKNEQHQSGE